MEKIRTMKEFCEEAGQEFDADIYDDDELLLTPEQSVQYYDHGEMIFYLNLLKELVENGASEDLISERRKHLQEKYDENNMFLTDEEKSMYEKCMG